MTSQNRKIYWLHTNHLGNSSRLTDRSGTMVYRGEYDPYGNLVYEWGSAGLNPRKFTGYERDATGLDYANARMYDPGRGRFMQPDPAGLKGAKMKIPGSLNRYSYVNNDPVNMVDVTKTTGIYFYLNPCIFMICDSMTVSAGLGSTIGHNPDNFNGSYLPEEGREDVIGFQDQYGLTHTEKMLCILYPEVCFLVGKARDYAQQERQRRFGQTGPNNDWCDNAFLHAYWNAQMVKALCDGISSQSIYAWKIMTTRLKDKCIINI